MATRKTPAYTPRWLYRFFAFLESLPIPLWALGLSIILFGGLAMHLDAWNKGLVPVGQYNGYLATVSLFNVGYLALWIFLDRRARLAVKDFFQNRGKSQAEVEAIYADFISLPPLPANLAFLGGTLFGYLGLPFAMRLQPLVGKVLPLWDLISWLPISGLIFMLLYRIIRQAFLLPRFFRAIDVDIFNPSPIYAISRYTSQVSIVLLIINYGLVFSSLPTMLSTSFGFLYQVFIIGPSLIYFFAPLASINQRMRKEKENLLFNIGEAQKKINAKLLVSVSSKKYTDLAELRNAVTALKEQREVLQKLTTRPWQSDTLRNLLAPLTLPIFVYLIQRYLGTLFGF